jgi:hypothetical protein
MFGLHGEGVVSVSDGKLDAYVFIDHVDPGSRIGDVLRDLFEQNPETVRFTAQFAGPFIGFARLELPGLKEAHELANGSFWDAGLRCETAVVIRGSQLRIPKRGSPAHCALVRARAADPDAALDALDERFAARHEEQEALPADERTASYGAAIVNGTYDLLIDVGMPTFEETRDLVRDDVRTVPGIERTVTAFAHLPGNERRR